jgi:hypothetical protein
MKYCSEYCSCRKPLHLATGRLTGSRPAIQELPRSSTPTSRAVREAAVAIATDDELVAKGEE